MAPRAVGGRRAARRAAARAGRQRRDEGNILLSFLAVMIVAMVVATVGMSVTGGQRQAQFDQSYEASLATAEDGLNQMISLIQANPDATTMAPVSVPGLYTVTATRTGNTWRLDSVGTNNGRTRHVRSTVTTSSLFNLAAFGKILVDFNGGNGADSYNSSTAGGSNLCAGSGGGSTPMVPCFPTHQGTVATNGELKLKGQTSQATDRMEIYNSKEYVENPLPTATGWCAGVDSTCDYRTSTPKKLFHYREPIVLPPITACAGATGNSAFSGGGTLAPGVKNYTNVTLTSSTVIQGTPANPTVICMNGTLRVPNANKVNFTMGTNGQPAPRPAGSLVILSTGPGIDLGNHSAIAAAIYAPNALASGGAQADVYGSLVANSINSNGAFAFHYDQGLADTHINAPAARSDWVEVR